MQKNALRKESTFENQYNILNDRRKESYNEPDEWGTNDTNSRKQSFMKGTRNH